MAGKLGIDVKTLRNWRKDKPELYKKVMQGFMFEEAVKEAKNHYDRLSKLSDTFQSQN
jgi:hypothetical protein